MAKRVLSALLVAGAILLLSAPAQAARKVTRSADATVYLATIASEGTPGNPGSASTSAGAIYNSRFGEGALKAVAAWGENLTFGANVRFFYGRGTLRSSVRGQAVANSDGSVSYSGTGQFTGGTGRYRGARGNFTFTGTAGSGANTAVYQFTGTVRY